MPIGCFDTIFCELMILAKRIKKALLGPLIGALGVENIPPVHRRWEILKIKGKILHISFIDLEILMIWI